MRTRTLPVCLLILGLGHGQSEAQSVNPPDRKQIVASRVSAGAVRIDGRLDEEIWLTAIPATDFTQSEPDEGVAPTDPLEVRFVFDDDALIVGARMSSADPASIQAPMSRRDEGIDQAEHILVSLDTYLDRRTAYTFGVTAAGVRFDHFHASDNRSSRDRSFDPVWEARVATDAGGWTAELRIPFQQLRFNANGEQVFGLNIYRAIPSRNEQVYWSLVRRTDRVWASRFGELRGIGGLTPSRRIELLPYTAGSSRLGGEVDDDDPFAGSDTQARVGGDVKVGVGPNLTVEATVNPDFGQVEADPAEVNLSAFETFFSERR
ncbi:MAG: carbohydrate binding family 9 domain-containing protein, partial [Acidobacteria bacterium]|nr:carbohydrate binding family 9 domain-containing protein [Acidobacteriota bacterium]